MAIEDIDLMTEEEMDLGSDPEMQDILKQLGAGEAQALMQLIKEYKDMVAKGFQGEFEDFVKIKMATAQENGDDVNEFQSEDEMIIEPDEMMDIEKQIVPTEMAANGGRIGYRKGGGADFINTHKPGPMGNPPVIEKIEDMREWRIANPDVEDVADYKSYYEKLKKKRKKKQEGGIMDVVEDEEMVETTPDQSRQEMIMDYLRDRGLPITPENIQKAIIEMITGGMPFTEEAAYEMPQVEQPSVLPRGMMMNETIRTPRGIASLTEDVMTPPVKPMLYDAPVDNQPWDTTPKTMFAAEGGFADDPAVTSQVSPSQQTQIQGNQMIDEAYQQIMQKFIERFPGLATGEETLEEMVAMLQAENVMETPGLGILGLDKSMDMIIPESAGASARRIMMGDTQYGDFTDEKRNGGRAGFDNGGPVDDDDDEYSAYVAEKQAAGEEYMDYDTYKLFKIQFPMAAGGRVPYGLGSLVKKVFKGATKGVKSLVKSVKKFAKSDLGKAALMYMATAGASSLGAGKGMGSLFKLGTYNPMTVGSNIQGSWGNLKNMFPKASPKLTDSGNLLKKVGIDEKNLLRTGKERFLYAPNSSQPSGLMSMLKNPMVTIPAAMLAGGAYTAANPGEENLDRVMADRNKEVANWDNIMANIRSGEMVTPFTTGNVMFPYPNYYQNVAEGGRIGRAEGGIMDLGGMEKDYRETGGFVPIGEYEKKDDVPARLSLNEFVMTADAVRGAGNGDVDKGAEVMEDMMETLEQQGQRHRQAQDMFSVSERLSEVVN